MVLSSHTLFADGVTSRLQLRDEALNLNVIDARSRDAMDQIINVRPDAVIVDASDKEASLNCPINELLAAIPALKIIRLDPEQAGFFDVELQNFSHAEQAYVENTAILTTTLVDKAGGAVRIIDYAPRYVQYGRSYPWGKLSAEAIELAVEDFLRDFPRLIEIQTWSATLTAK